MGNLFIDQIGDATKNPVRFAAGADSYDCAKSGGTNVDACSRAALKDAIQVGCTAACAATGAGVVVAALCGPISSVVAKYAYDTARDLLVGFGSSVQQGIMAILPDGWAAHGVVSAANIADDVWAAAGIVDKWQQAQSAVQAAWDQGRVSAGLGPAPIMIQNDLLVPKDPADRMPFDGSAIYDTNQHHELFWGKDSVAVLASGIYSTSPAACLQRWLYSSKTGWLHEHRCSANTSKGWARVDYTPIVGPVEYGSAPLPGADPNVWYGVGPFGLYTNGWQHDLQGGDARGFADCVASQYSLRLQTLQRALIEVLQAVSAQILIEKQRERYLSSIKTIGGSVVVGAASFGVGFVAVWALKTFWPDVALKVFTR